MVVCVFVSSVFNDGLDGSPLATAVSLAAFELTIMEYTTDIAPSWCHSLLAQLTLEGTQLYEHASGL